MPAVFVVLIGVAVLLRVLEVLRHKPFWIAIAILVILAGLQQLCSGMCKCCDQSGDGESCKK
jgi:uncharacterized protein YqgC (DUF456 family)